MATVFTADVVEYNFTPEKYATAVAGVTAEMTIAVTADWQGSLKTWWTSESAEAVAAKDVLIGAQDGLMDRADAANVAALQGMVYQIGSDAGWYAGTATDGGAGGEDCNVQLKKCLDAVLGAYAAQTGAPNALSIDASKVQADMQRAADSSSLDALAKVPSTNAQTTIIGCLLNAHAFGSVCDRLIKAGNFIVGDLDNSSGSGAHVFQGEDHDGSGDYISDAAKLIFPIKITVADDGETAGESDTNTVNAITFQLNLSFCKSGSPNAADSTL